MHFDKCFHFIEFFSFSTFRLLFANKSLSFLFVTLNIPWREEKTLDIILPRNLKFLLKRWIYCFSSSSSLYFKQFSSSFFLCASLRPQDKFSHTREIKNMIKVFFVLFFHSLSPWGSQSSYLIKWHIIIFMKIETNCFGGRKSRLRVAAQIKLICIKARFTSTCCRLLPIARKKKVSPLLSLLIIILICPHLI